MKTGSLYILAFGLLLGALGSQIACDRMSTLGPASSGGSNGGGTTSGPTTIMVSTGSSSMSASGYVYTSSSGSNGTGGVLSLTAHVGDVIILPGSGFHPLYFDAGTTTCIYAASTGTQTYTFPATGTYYFHCGNHGSCPNNSVCGATSCTAMAGVVTVN